MTIAFTCVESEVNGMIKALAQSRTYMISYPIPTLKSNGFFCLFSFENISFSISKPPEYSLV